MSWIPALGSTCMGLVIGWLIRYFIRRFKSFNTKALGSVVSIIAGGAIVHFLQADSTARWFYPIGLALGFIVYSLIAVLAGSAKEGALYSMTTPSDGPKTL
jgi:hypothetical protein